MKYDQRGVSAQKEEVHHATRNLGKGLFDHSFCKLYPDFLGNDKDWVNIMHADGAGTKSILAYLYWKETGDIEAWKGIAQDAIVMNLDDCLCVGIYDHFLFSSTIDRNKKLIPGEVLEAIIEGHRDFFSKMESFGINIGFMGGETADVGDLVKTISVNGTLAARWPLSRIINNEKIVAGDVIVGLSGSGQANYESNYNSGIASNGLTSARHDMLHKTYGARFRESYDHSLDESLVYIGPHRLTDQVEWEENDRSWSSDIGHLLLSPTRTFAPLIKRMLENNFDAVHGMVHCSGGGQTKCLKYVPANVKIIKDNLPRPPIVFDLIKHSSGSSDREMYQVFNMGTRMEIYTDEKSADAMISAAHSFNIDAQVIGRVEASEEKQLLIKTPSAEIRY
jgi:phosphoribosylformylglycinamidine cyclo-ligase